MNHPDPKAVRDAVAELFLVTPLIQRLGLERQDLVPMARRGMQLLGGGNSADALSIFVRLVLFDPQNVDYQRALCHAAIAEGKGELAMQGAAIILSETPRSPEGWFLSGQAATLMGETALAIEDFQDAARLAREAGMVEMATAAERMIAHLRSDRAGSVQA